MTTPSSSAAPWWAMPSGLRTQELRVAASFSGGVSLAIWMGGLTYEVDRLLRSSDAERAHRHGDPPIRPADARYAALLSLLGIDVDVDVITGTSAGGINGAALATARAHGSSLEPLRDVWLERGSFTTLMRPLEQPDPPSLLQGDGVLLAGLRDGLDAIVSRASTVPGSGRRTSVGKPNEPFPSRENRMRLLVTATMAAPDVTTVRDVLGTAIYLEDNQAIFSFEQPSGTAPAPGDLSVAHLARAARSSASYPAAFEPSFVRVGDGPESEPDMGAHLGIRSSRWMIDGGLRNNQPVGTALRAVWEQPAGEGVRRVLLHVVPDPGKPEVEKASADEVPGLFAALGMTAAAPLVQSWTADLETTRRQASGSQRRREGLTSLHALVTDGQRSWPTLAAALRTTRAGWVADDFVSALDAQLSRFAKAGKGPGATWSLFSSERFEALRAQCRQRAREHWDGAAAFVPYPDPTGDETADEQAAARVDAQIAVLLAHHGPDLFNASLALLLRGLRQGEPPSPRVARPQADRGRAVAEEEPSPWARSAKALHETRTAGGARVRFERDLLETFLQRRLAATSGVGEDGAVAWAAGLFDRWLVQAFPPPEPPDEAVAAETDVSAHLRASWTALLGWIRGPGVALRVLGDEITDPGAMLSCVAARGAIDLLAMGDGRLSEQSIDLVQLSGFTRTWLAPEISTPAQKLMGVGMAHFGAFVRRPWRANDWMWGRLDGAGWLVHVLLAPDRLRRAADALAPGRPRREQVEALVTALRTIACSTDDGAPDPDLVARWDEVQPALRDELDALASDRSTIQALPTLALAVGYGLQRDIAAEELVVVATAIEQSESGRPIAPRSADREFVAGVKANLATDGTRVKASAVRDLMTRYSVMRNTAPVTLLDDAELRTTLFDALAVGASAVDSSTPRETPVLPQVSRVAHRSSKGLARTVRSNSLSGWMAILSVAVGAVLLVVGGPILTALGLPLVVGGGVSLVLTGLGRRTWLERALPLILPIGVVAAIGVAWWVSRSIDEADLARYGVEIGRPLIIAGAGLATVLLAVAVWWLVRVLTQAWSRAVAHE